MHEKQIAAMTSYIGEISRYSSGWVQNASVISECGSVTIIISSIEVMGGIVYDFTVHEEPIDDDDIASVGTGKITVDMVGTVTVQTDITNAQSLLEFIAPADVLTRLSSWGFHGTNFTARF